MDRTFKISSIAWAVAFVSAVATVVTISATADQGRVTTPGYVAIAAFMGVGVLFAALLARLARLARN